MERESNCEMELKKQRRNQVKNNELGAFYRCCYFSIYNSTTMNIVVTVSDP